MTFAKQPCSSRVSSPSLHGDCCFMVHSPDEKDAFVSFTYHGTEEVLRLFDKMKEFRWLLFATHPKMRLQCLRAFLSDPFPHLVPTMYMDLS